MKKLLIGLLFIVILFILATIVYLNFSKNKLLEIIPMQSARNLVVKTPVQYIKINDIKIAYKTFGTSNANNLPLIMITGSGITMDLWSPDLLLALAKNRQVIIFDNRGMGLTTSSPQTYSIRLFAEDTASLMDALHIAKADILGWSMGGNIAQELVLKYPQKVHKLILYATDVGKQGSIPGAVSTNKILAAPNLSANERMLMLLDTLIPKDWHKTHIPYLRAHFPLVSESTPEVNIERQNIAIRNYRGTLGRLHQITCPTLIITGSEDLIIPPLNSKILHQTIANSKLIIITGGGHGVMYQGDKKLELVILHFL